ncbi:unnamed protein product [Polarella glacialis]|uniref:Uncharacterized protein n=1 Tax=Polarella glacialis TaxID=89957 RepID=A0A813LLK0_POLGL|nr:unnamed protein product [Polarella glacialis]
MTVKACLTVCVLGANPLTLRHSSARHTGIVYVKQVLGRLCFCGSYFFESLLQTTLPTPMLNANTNLLFLLVLSLCLWALLRPVFLLLFVLCALSTCRASVSSNTISLLTVIVNNKNNSKTTNKQQKEKTDRREKLLEPTVDCAGFLREASLSSLNYVGLVSFHAFGSLFAL